MINCGTFSKEVEMFVSDTPDSYVSAKGAFIEMHDGSIFLDTVLGLGAYPRGYDSFIAGEVTRTLGKTHGLISGLPHQLWKRVSSAVCHILNLDAVRPVRTGSDGCLAAVTLARAVRPGKVVVARNAYHGQWLQWKAPARGSMLDMSQFIVVDPEDPETWPGHTDVSCIIYEYPINPPGHDWWIYIEAMRKEGVIFIADEVVTALRFPGNRAIPYSDLIVAGKGLANGFGLYVVGGRLDLMNEFNIGNPVFISSTYTGDVAALAATDANLSLSDSKTLGDTLTMLGIDLWNKLDPEFFDQSAPLHINGQPSRWIFEGDAELLAGLCKCCLDNGMLVNRPFLTCTAHVGHLDYMAETLNNALQSRRRAKAPRKLFTNR